MDDNPLSLWMYFGGGLRVCMALKVLLCSNDDESPQHWSVLRAILHRSCIFAPEGELKGNKKSKIK
jgi:hypothetical protein